jgi:hypothetical protein
MRKLMLAFAVGACLSPAASLFSGQALAMTMGTPAGVRGVIEETNLIDKVTYGCRAVWRCGPYGCGWRRVCYRPYAFYHRPYAFYHRPYGFYRPYWGYRRHWW